MKRVVLSFDDGRKDFYSVVFPILKEYGITATLNVVPDFIIHPQEYARCICNESISVEELKEIMDYGIEIACHGNTHKNTVEDVLQGVENINKMIGCELKMGFASPTSYLTLDNSARIRELIYNDSILYIRTGLQVKREGLFFAIFSKIERITHSKVLFKLLNNKMMKHDYNNKFFYSVPVTRYTTLNQIIHMVHCMKEEDVLILCMHSIIIDEKFHQNKIWTWKEKYFRELCKTLSNDKDISLCTNLEIIKEFISDVS